MGSYIGNLCLATPMDRYKYMHIRIKLIPQEFVTKIYYDKASQ